MADQRKRADVSAAAQQMLLAGMNAPATVTYQGGYAPTNVGSTATQTGVSFGPLANGRLIPIAVQWNAIAAGSAITNATIGGVPASVAIQGTILFGASIWHNLAIIAAIVPTGTSGTVVVNFTGPISSFINVWQATNIQSATPFGTGSAVSASSPISANCNLQAGGIVVLHENTLSISTPFTMSGVTKDYEGNPTSVNGSITGGSAVSPSAVTGALFQVSDPGGTAGGPFRSLIVASFR